MIEIIVGDSRKTLTSIPDKSIQCVVTSPPYWGLRKYKGNPDMIGQEPDFLTHMKNLMAVFDEIWRVLRDDGTFWLNYGDAYSGSGRGHTKPDNPGMSDSFKRMGDVNRNNKGSHDLEPNKDGSLGIPPKSLMMMPARIALALQDRGWVLRSEVIWSKVNCMPESVQDRPTSSHEKLYLFAKQQRYFYDIDAVKTPQKEVSLQRMKRARFDNPDVPHGSKASALYRPGRGLVSDPNTKTRQALEGKTDVPSHRRSPTMRIIDEAEQNGTPYTDNKANLRDVWRLATAGFRGGHFAMFPTALVEPCIKAGTSEHGACAQCGAPYRRVIERTVKEPLVETPYATGEITSIGGAIGHQGEKKSTLHNQSITKIQRKNLGWQKSCDCETDERKPQKVLDPFGGAGTTALVADRLGRDAVLCEISDEYAEMAKSRLIEDDPLRCKVVVK